MAEFTHIDLRSARETRKMPRWKLATEVGVSEDTLERWETGKQRPDPDDVGNIERVLNMPGLWHKWMLSTYDSYRERNTDMPYVNHPAALLLRMKHEVADMWKLAESVERDSVDGRFDDQEQLAHFQKEAREAAAALQQIAEWKPSEFPKSI